MENVPPLLPEPPPNYDEVFKSKDSGNENKHNEFEFSENPLEFLKKFDLIPQPVTKETINSGISGSIDGLLYKKYLILDGETGAEVLYGLDIPSTNQDLRALSIRLDNGQEVLKSGYVYSPNFSTIEFAKLDGSPLGVFKKEGFGPGICGCFCLCFCCPVASAAIKALDGQPLLIFKSHMFPRKIDAYRPEHLGGDFMATIDVENMNSDSIVKTTFGENAAFIDKLLICGLTMCMMDYERLHSVRNGNQFISTESNFML